jgi:hypothetical protein
VATRLNADWLSSREIRVKVQIFELERIFRATNSRERARLYKAKVWRDKSKLVARFLSETHLYVHFVWDPVAPARLV